MNAQLRRPDHSFVGVKQLKMGEFWLELFILEIQFEIES